MMDDLTPVLSRLPEPMPPSTLTATVMARIEREAEQRASTTVVPGSRARELQPWFWTFAGVAVVLLVVVKGWLSSGALPSFTSARIGFGHAPLMPVDTRVSLFLALGLFVYVAGLFAPLRSGGKD